MKCWVGVTDTKWYRYLRERTSEDISFWQPNGQLAPIKNLDLASSRAR